MARHASLAPAARPPPIASFGRSCVTIPVACLIRTRANARGSRSNRPVSPVADVPQTEDVEGLYRSACFEGIYRESVLRCAGKPGGESAPVARPLGGPPWRIFVSHTSELREYPKDGSYVDAVKGAISATGHVVVDMSDFPSA